MDVIPQVYDYQQPGGSVHPTASQNAGHIPVSQDGQITVPPPVLSTNTEQILASTKKSKKLGKASEHVVAAALNISGGIAEIVTGIPL
ncbi:hypothetical protein H0H87_004035, partial [Tephrocybe sp. NHM501043]